MSHRGFERLKSDREIADTTNEFEITRIVEHLLVVAISRVRYETQGHGFREERGKASFDYLFIKRLKSPCAVVPLVRSSRKTNTVESSKANLQSAKFRRQFPRI